MLFRSQPGGNATGVNFFSAELVAKRLGLLHELVPKAVRVAVLLNPANPAGGAAFVGGADEQYILWRRPVERWPGRNAVSQPSGHSPVHAFR